MKELTELEHSEYWLWWYNIDADKYSIMVSDSYDDKVKEDDVGGVEQVKEDNVGGVEHVKEVNVGDVEQVEEANVGGVEQVEDMKDIDFEIDGLSFDNSEDERDLGLDNCFEFIENQVEENGKRGRIKVAARKHKHTPKKVPSGVDNLGSCSGVDNEMIINYASDEPDSSDPDASDGEKEPKYPRAWKAKEIAKALIEDGLKKGITTSCRPFIGVDGCHLKTKFEGTLLIAVGRDPNYQHYPIAFGGLIPVFEELFERVEHRLCLRHLYANFNKKFGGGTQIKGLMMAAAKATYIQVWDDKMKELKELNVKPWEWLLGIPTKAWCRYAFYFYPGCDVLMNNVSDTFNITLLVERDKPILTMCEWIRNYLMNRNANLRERVDRWNHRIMPRPRLRLDKEVEHAGNLIPNYSGDTIWKVEHTHTRNSFIVDTSKKTYTCNFWELVSIPCRHAVIALGFRNQSPKDFVDDCYSKDMYGKCYGYNVSHINGQDIWSEVDMEEILPPSYKRGLGRPKKLRRREPDEEPNKEQPQPNETQIDFDPEFEMLAANLAAAFEATQTQPNLVVNGPVASAQSHSALVTSA
ncbi:hypothetical protein KIW84_042262 [Lathyrus oleraceus]|uniref:SWIM-type domain-containing protein n=1 Tax=Pisum sativum TaxID=3888 RepID=A0A9D4XAL3_PEA|nr:hypothetical protein KIW84_042262 [Pisum sativum]